MLDLRVVADDQLVAGGKRGDRPDADIASVDLDMLPQGYGPLGVKNEVAETRGC
jgi:hypothetical protein